MLNLKALNQFSFIKAKSLERLPDKQQAPLKKIIN